MFEILLEHRDSLKYERGNKRETIKSHQQLQKLNDTWDIENIVAAHMGNRLGDCKEQLAGLLANDSFWADLAKKKRDEEPADNSLQNVEGDECGQFVIHKLDFIVQSMPKSFCKQESCQKRRQSMRKLVLI